MFARIASFRKVYDSYAWRCRWKVVVRDFHLRLAKRAIGVQSPSVSVVEAFEFCPEVDGVEWQPEPCLPPEAGFHVGFLRQLTVWMQGLQWAVSTTDGLVADISWLELFWQWIYDTGCLPPVTISGRMVSLGEEPEVICCLPDVAVLWGLGRRGLRPCVAVDFCLGGAVSLVQGQVLPWERAKVCLVSSVGLRCLLMSVLIFVRSS